MENIRPNVLIFIDWFLPAYKAGGPIQSVSNLVEQLSDSFNFFIVTSDADLNASLNISQEDKNRWIDKNLYHIIYLDRAHQSSSMFKSLFKELNIDVIYLNSLFSIQFSIVPLKTLSSIKVKILLAPRGMLGKGALSIKPLKKIIFLKAFKLLGWHKRVEWHATASSEKEEILKNFGGNVIIHIASNLSKKTRLNSVSKLKAKNKLNVFFLSRISYKKNLILAIKALGKIVSRFSINFTIIGPVEDKVYWKECKEKLQKLPKHIVYEVLGATPNEKINNILKNQHILFLPTRHENFGHVIVESWQNGCPTIISDQTPWTQLEEKKVGVDIPLAQEHLFKEKVEMFASMDQEEFNTWSTSAKKYVYQITNDEMLIKQYKKILSPQA